MKLVALLLALGTTANIAIACTPAPPSGKLDLTEDEESADDDDDDDDDDDESSRGRGAPPPGQRSNPTPPANQPSPDSGTTTPPNGSPEQTCHDFAVVIAKAAQRCGQNYQENYDEFIDAAANGSCSNVTAIRNETELRTQCFAHYAAVSCSQLLDQPPSSCVNQLQ